MRRDSVRIKHFKVPAIFLFTWFFFCPIIFAQELRDIKPPIDPRPNFFWLIVLLVAVVLAVIIYFGWRFFIKLKKVAASPQVIHPPHEVAYERLDQLRQRNLPAHGQIKEFFSELSDIIRRYIEGRFHIDAPEMTTEEFLWSLKQSIELSNNHKSLLQDFLNCCDLVKFAKYGPSTEEIDKSFDSAKRFVDETKPLLESISSTTVIARRAIASRSNP